MPYIIVFFTCLFAVVFGQFGSMPFEALYVSQLLDLGVLTQLSDGIEQPAIAVFFTTFTIGCVVAYIVSSFASGVMFAATRRGD